MKEAIATQILLGFLLGHYVVFIDGVSLKSEGGIWGGSLVSWEMAHDSKIPDYTTVGPNQGLIHPYCFVDEAFNTHNFV
jgi:hypothetical protein